MICYKAEFRNPLSLLTHERTHFATCVQNTVLNRLIYVYKNNFERFPAPVRTALVCLNYATP